MNYGHPITPLRSTSPSVGLWQKPHREAGDFRAEGIVWGVLGIGSRVWIRRKHQEADMSSFGRKILQEEAWRPWNWWFSHEKVKDHFGQELAGTGRNPGSLDSADYTWWFQPMWNADASEKRGTKYKTEGTEDETKTINDFIFLSITRAVGSSPFVFAHRLAFAFFPGHSRVPPPPFQPQPGRPLHGVVSAMVYLFIEG